MRRRVFLVGGAITTFIGKGHPDFIHPKHPDFGTKTNPTIEDYITRACNDALRNTQVKDPGMIDCAAIGNFCGELFVQQGHLGAALVGAVPALAGKPTVRTEGACASGALAMYSCVESILAGRDVALAVGAEVQSTVSARVGGDYLARASHYSRQRKIDEFTFPALFAQRTKHIVAKGHFTLDDMARVAAKAYANGNKNPLAHMRTKKVTFEEAQSSPNFLANPDLKPWLRLTDASQVSDGGAALIVASEEGLRKLGKTEADCVEILALECATGSLWEDPADFTKMDISATCAKRALAKAGIKATDLQVAEVHDCFATAELLMYEALGIAEYGKAKELIRNGDTSLDGRIPVNTGGGLLSFGHPVGATGVKQVLEIFRQMKGQCGDYQLPKRPVFGASLNMGGDDRTSVCAVMKNL